MVDFAAGHITSEQARPIIEALDAELGGGRDGIRFHPGVEYRHLCVVPLALGDKWQGAVVPLQLLALSTGFRAVTPVLSQVLNAVGQSRLSMQYGLLSAVVLPPAFYLLGQRWGTVGLALVWLFVFPILVVPACRRALQTIELPSREYLRALWPAASASLLMAATVLAVKVAAGEHLSRVVSLSAQVVAGAVVYILTCMTLYGARIASLSRILRSMRALPRPAG